MLFSLLILIGFIVFAVGFNKINISCFLLSYQALPKFRTEISTDFVDNLRIEDV